MDLDFFLEIPRGGVERGNGTREWFGRKVANGRGDASEGLYLWALERGWKSMIPVDLFLTDF